MITNRRIKKTIKCKNAMPFEKKLGENFLKFVKSEDLLEIKRF
jgi:hypothetical protein